MSFKCIPKYRRFILIKPLKMFPLNPSLLIGSDGKKKHSLILFQIREQVHLPWKLNDMFYSELNFYTVHSHSQCKDKRLGALSWYGCAWFQIMGNWKRWNSLIIYLFIFKRFPLEKYASCTWGRWKGAIKVTDAWEQTQFSSDPSE